jgi:hypothetical protein
VLLEAFGKLVAAGGVRVRRGGGSISIKDGLTFKKFFTFWLFLVIALHRLFDFRMD